VPLDRYMGSKQICVRFLRRRFVIDCSRNGSFAFGTIREMFIRNCYIRHGIEHALASAQTVLDLGTNQGIFSTMAATGVRIVVALDAQSHFVEAVKHNMAINRFNNYIVETAFVGAGGLGDSQEKLTRNTVSIQEIADKHRITKFDLAKIDIEGSEFALFGSPEWLRLVGAICMEVHPAFGAVQNILDSLEKNGFSVVVTDDLFRPVQSAQDAVFIYAVKGDSPLSPRQSPM
jgi:predicted nicotinamide N-methyase